MLPKIFPAKNWDGFKKRHNFFKESWETGSTKDNLEVYEWRGADFMNRAVEGDRWVGYSKTDWDYVPHNHNWPDKQSVPTNTAKEVTEKLVTPDEAISR